MANSFELAKRYSPALQKAMVEKSRTGFFADNTMLAKFRGASQVLLPRMTVPGMGNYSTETGYAPGDTTVVFDVYELTMDRSRELTVDREVADETGIGNISGYMASELVRTSLVPETDAHCMSTLAAKALEKSHTETATIESVEALDVLNDLSIKAGSELGFSNDVPFVFFVSAAMWSRINTDPKLTRFIHVGEFKRGKISIKINMFNDIPIIPMGNGDVMKTVHTYDPGATGSAGGFSAGPAAKDLYAMIAPKNGVAYVPKVEKTKIWSPDENQKKDEWKIQLRWRYDHFIYQPYENGIFTVTSA